MLAWGEQHLRHERCLSLDDARNSASLQVLAKCDFTVLAQYEYNGQAAVVLHRPLCADQGN